MPTVPATPAFRLGAWGGSRGYPTATAFHDGRQVFAGGPSASLARRVDGSKQPGFNVFSPGEGDDADAWSRQLSAQGSILHLVSSRSLLALTTDEERSLSGDGNTSPITPSAFSDRNVGHRGASNVHPVAFGNAGLFIDRTGKALIELAYDALEEGYLAPDLALLAQHIMRSSAVEGKDAAVDMDAASRPNTVVYVARADGALLAFTYLREERVTGWTRLHIGDGAGKVRGLAVLPGENSDDLFAVVEYQVGGETRQYIQVLEAPVSLEQSLEDATYLDSVVTKDGSRDGALSLSAADGNGVTCTSTGSAFTSADVGRDIRYTYIVTNDHGLPIRDNAGDVQHRTAIARITGFTSASSVTANITAAFPVLGPIPQGKWGVTRFLVTGLAHLEGETVSIVGDGVQQPSRLVLGGSVNLSRAAAKVHLGLPYSWRWTTLPLETGSRQGTSQGKPTNISRALVRVVRTRGLEMGAAGSPRYPAAFPDIESGQAAPLTTGDLELSGTGWKRGLALTLGHGSAYPASVVLIVPHSQTGEAT